MFSLRYGMQLQCFHFYSQSTSRSQQTRKKTLKYSKIAYWRSRQQNMDKIKLLTEACYSCLQRGSTVPDKYRDGSSQPTIRLNTGSPMKELKKGPKNLMDQQPHRRNNNMSQPVPPEIPGIKLTTKDYTWWDSRLQLNVQQRMAQLVFNGRRGPLSCESSMPHCREMPGSRRGSGQVRIAGGGRKQGVFRGENRKGDNVRNVNKVNI